MSASDGTNENFVTVSWSKVEAATKYEIQRCLDKTGLNCEIVAQNVTGLSRNISGGDAGKIYQFRIRACNDESCSGWTEYDAGSRAVYSVPDVPQQSLSGIIGTDGKATTAGISIGASSDGGATSKTKFSSSETINIVTKIYPRKEDVGEEGEIFVVLRVIQDGKKVFYSLDPDGLWLPWNASLKTLEPTRSVDSLLSEEAVEVYSGTMTVGSKFFYVGYSVADAANGKPIIYVNGKPFRIDVLLGGI